MSDDGTEQSLVSLLIPTLIVEFLCFRFLLGCIDVEDDSKIFLSLTLDDSMADDPALGFSLFWLFDSRPMIGFSLMPEIRGYFLWIASNVSDDGPDLPKPNGQA